VKRAIKYIIIGLAALVLIFFGFYFYVNKLRALAFEGNQIFALRCVKVNPPLIKYKAAFLKWADYVNSGNPDKQTKDEVNRVLDDYMNGMKEYVPAETIWLEMQQKYINRWDFKLFQPWYMKKAVEYQWKMYEGYRDDAKYMVESYESATAEEDSEIKYKEALAKQIEARQRRDEYIQKYFDFYKEASAIKDWRKIFQTLPNPEECTEENMTIPNTSGSIDWEEKPATPSPNMVPIDPKTTG
jgi:hypothetical protein